MTEPQTIYQLVARGESMLGGYASIRSKAVFTTRDGAETHTDTFRELVTDRTYFFYLEDNPEITVCTLQLYGGENR